VTSAARGARFDEQPPLVVTNMYPTATEPYRNGFVHRRVVEYARRGLRCDVYVVRPGESLESSAYDYEGVRVTVGNADEFDRAVSEMSRRVYLVHFASPEMIRPLQKHAPESPVVVWIHGFEAEAWHRRWFGFVDSSRSIRAALDRRAEYFDRQNAFLAWLISTDELSVDTVYVSDWFKRNVVEPDLKVSSRRAHIIPNFVDTELFAYHEKDPAARTRILSLRPFASPKYANDLTVAAILELSRRPGFDELEFTVIGDGALFDRVTEPMRDLPNVTLRKALLEQTEIPALHADAGVFLAPTRFDSQGVSMSEAMSSGLVPVSTAIAAIPEFVESGVTGLLAAPEDPVGLADHIERLHESPELFAQLSRAASAGIKELAGYDATVAREIALVRARMEGSGVE